MMMNYSSSYENKIKLSYFILLFFEDRIVMFSATQTITG